MQAIKTASINIQLGLAGGLEVVLCSLQQGNVGIGVLQDKKMMEVVYMWHSSRYYLWVTEADIRHWVGIEITWQWGER